MIDITLENQPQKLKAPGTDVEDDDSGKKKRNKK
jgi:hypothetical protein